MNIPEEFGSYLLLKKLTEDALGETFRAGKVGNAGMEQVVLLRVLNGKGMDGDKLWAKVSGRAAVQQALKSSNIGNGVDLGRVRNYAYAAYDYISGKNLAVLFARAAKQGSPIPADHAMLVAERISMALAVAYEGRVQDERIVHGFVVPQLVMVSNEGETRLLGFELAPGLRELAAGGWHDADLDRYLSPETRAGQPLSRADDVWSLGAILLELLTGEPLAAAGAEDLGAAIDAAIVANEGTPLPEPLAALLKKSLVPRADRIADAVTWHKAISKLMIEGQYSPTTFNLAFFMHNLFRDEIDRESEEIQAEKGLAVAPAPVAPAAAARPLAAAAARPAADMREKTGVREATLAGAGAPAASASGGGKGMWIGIAAALAAVVLGGGGWLLFGRPGPKPAPAPAAAVQPPPVAPAAGTAAPAPAAPRPEEIQAQIAAMFDARSKEMEAKLKGQYDDKIKALQKQLQDSKKEAPAERPAHGAAAPPLSTEAKEARSVHPDAPPLPTEPPAPPPAAGTVAPAAAARTTPPVAAPGGSAAPSPAAAVPPAAAPATDAAPAALKTQIGDLVQAGPGVVAPKMSGMPEPRYPSAARHMNKSADVQIRVLVDELGRVVQTQPVGARVGYGFDEAAMEAARHSSYRPATKDGVRVKMWTVMRVSFKP